MENIVEVSTQENITEPSFIANIEPFAKKIMKELKIKNSYVSILFCNNEYIRELNKEYRQIDSPTDVLSFENGDIMLNENGKKFCTLGDIVISIEMIGENASYFKTDDNDELKRLLVHGILHLTGMDHGEEHIESGKAPVCKMLIRQEKILTKFTSERIIG